MTVVDDDTALQNSNNEFLKLDFTKLPQLIGRSKEREILDEVYSRLPRNGATAEIIFVHGESGVGKSTLIEHLQDKIVKQRTGGYFACGKSDQLHNATKPYGAIVDAITDLSNQVIDNSKVLQDVQKDLFDALGQETSMLTNLIPALADLLAKPIENDGAINTRRKQQESSSQAPTPSSSSASLILLNNDNTPTQLPHEQPSRQNSASSRSSHNSNIKNVTANKKETNGFSFQIFVHLFRTFLRTFCKPTRPLILFLDDLQWADDASCKLIKSISSDPTIQNLILVGAYRDKDEATFDFDHHACKLKVTDILVGPLSLENISELITTITSTSQEDDANALAQVVLQKTGGNTFFALQYLEALHRQKLLYYDFAATKWAWNVNQIERNTTVSDNIVGLLIGKIQSLREELQSILMFASCLGFSFDTEILEQILISEKVFHNTQELTNNGTVDFTSLLIELSREGLVQLFNERKYQFSHDRVQQSSYSLLPQSKEKDLLHLRIGKIILDYCKGPKSESWMLFRAADLLSQQSVYITDESEKMELIDLNIKAANEAVSQMSFLSSAHYVRQAIGLLDPATMWNDRYELCLELFNMHAKMQHACGEYEKCLKIVNIILQNAKTLQDKLPAYHQRVLINSHKVDVVDAFSECRSILKKLGVRFPHKSNLFSVIIAVIKTKRLLNGRTAKDLVSLPAMTDKKKIMTMEFLARFITSSYELNHVESLLVACMKMARISIKYGVCQLSLYAFSAYGSVVAYIDDAQEGVAYAKLLYELLKRPGLESGSVYCMPNICLFLDHIKAPLQDSLPKLLDAYRSGMEQGDVENSTIALMGHGIVTTIIGMRMDNLNRQLHSYCEILCEFSQESRSVMLSPYYQFALNMAGKSANPLVLTGDFMNEDTMEKLAESNQQVSKHFYFVRLMTRYIFGVYDGADYDRKILDKSDTNDNTMFSNFFMFLYAGLTCFAVARKYPKKRKMYQRLAESYINRIKKYVSFGSVNGPPMLKLLLAEKLSFSNDSVAVKDAYDTAIRFNRRSGFRILTCLCLERAGDYYYDTIGDFDIAKDYLQSAYLEYEDICAFGKSKLLKEKYQFLQKEESSLSSESRGRSTTASSKFQGNVVRSLKDKDSSLRKKLGLHAGGTGGGVQLVV